MESTTLIRDVIPGRGIGGVTPPKFTNADFVRQILVTGRANSEGKLKNKS